MRRSTLVPAALICCVVFALLLAPLPDAGRAVNALLDCAHAPAFALLSYLLCRLFSAQTPQQFRTRGRLILAATALTGIAVELSQQWLGRTTSLQDAAANVLGAAAGVHWFRRHMPGPRPRWPVLALLLIGLGCALPGLTLFDVVRQHRQMPLIASFEDTLELSRWSRNDAAWDLAARHATQGESALHVELHPTVYPGVTLNDPVADWSDYRALAFDAFNEETTDLHIVLKVEDAAHEGDVRDRYNGRIVLPPGATTVRVPLSEIAAAPEGRRMDMRRITKLQLFAVRPPEPKSFYLDNIRLE